jgi:hypothetical protein
MIRRCRSPGAPACTPGSVYFPGPTREVMATPYLNISQNNYTVPLLQRKGRGTMRVATRGCVIIGPAPGISGSAARPANRHGACVTVSGPG